MSNQPNWTDDELDLLNAIRAGKTVVVNMRKKGHPRFWAWAKANDLAVRIDRKSKWGNPYTIGTDGDRDEVLRKYGVHLWHTPRLVVDARALRGKALGCWCKPDGCHGDTLARLSEVDDQ